MRKTEQNHSDVAKSAYLSLCFVIHTSKIINKVKQQKTNMSIARKVVREQGLHVHKQFQVLTYK